MRVQRRARGSGLGPSLTLGLVVWVAGTAAALGLDLDRLITSRVTLGPGRVAALVALAHLGLGAISVARLGASGLAVVVARAVLHALLAVATALALVLVGGLAVEAALARATWDGPVALLVQVVGVGLGLAPLETAPPPRRRHTRASRPAGLRAADHAGRSSARFAGSASASAMASGPGLPAGVPTVAPEVSSPVPALLETARPAVTMHVNGGPERPSDTDQGPRREVPAATAAEAPAASRAEDPAAAPEGVDPTIRIPFDRVVEQLPAEAFRVPLDRVGACLLEPGYLLVPQRLVAPQIGEGQASVAWSAVAEQFPHQVLAWERPEVGRRLPGGALALPLDEVVRQLPPDLFVVPGATPDMRALEDFPLPFQPHVPPPSEEQVAAPVEPSPAGAGGPELGVEPEPPEPDPESVAPGEAAAPLGEPDPAVEAAVEDAPAPEPAGLPAALGLRGAWQLRTHRLDGLRIITLTGSDVAPEEVARLAADLAGLLDDPRLPGPVSQLTVRGAGATLVFTPIDALSAGGPLLAATAEPGAALAQLERAALRMARGLQDGRRRRLPPEPPSDLVETPVPATVREAAQRMRAFGTLAPTVLGDGTGLTLYLLLAPGAAARPVAGWARDLRAAVRGGRLGSLESAMVRLGEDRLLIREVAVGRGAAALLVVGGAPLSRPGLARLEIERAVARLGAG